MLFKSCFVNVFTVTIIVFIIRSEKKLIVISLFKKLIHDIQNNLHVDVDYVDNRLIENKNEAVETHIPRHRNSKKKSHEIEVPRPKNCDIEIRGRLKHHNIEKQSQLSHDIMIASHFFRGQKATTLRFQD